MKPSSVATASFTTGTSRGVTVVTSTSGGGGATCASLREQPLPSQASTKAPIIGIVFITYFCGFKIHCVFKQLTQLRDFLSPRSSACNSFPHVAFACLV